MKQALLSIRWSRVAFAAALVGGAMLRLVWLDDIEYKFDEAWAFQTTRAFVRHGEFSPHGAASSQNVRHMGMSIWIFYPLGYLFGADDPTELARGVAVLSIVALLLLTALVHRVVPEGEHEYWYWAIALVALNPHAIIMARKLWAICLTPCLVVAFIACWWKRDRAWGAFGWGLLGILFGQIHLGAFFYSAAAVLGVVIYARKDVAWRAWLLGTAVGFCFMVPWLLYLLDRPDAPREDAFRIHRPLHFRFWLYWFTEPFSLGLDHYLRGEKVDFLARPIIATWASCLNGVCYALCFLVAVLLVLSSLVRWRRRRFLKANTATMTSLLVNSALVGYGIIMTMTFLPVFRHYLIITFPLMYVWIARMALAEQATESAKRRGRLLLTILCVCSAWLSLELLRYIHERQSAPSTYGQTYGALVKEQGKRPPDHGPASMPEHPHWSLPIPLP